MFSHLIEEELVPPEAQCNSFHRIPNLSYVAICDFINATAACKPDDGFIDYLKFIYCALADTSSPELWPLLLLLVILWLLFLLNGLSLVADDFLCPTLNAIHRQLGLSENLVGVTFVAFGNGAPDIFGALAALDGDRPEPGLAFGALFGAGIFVTTVVVGAIAIIKPFPPMQRPLLRDIIFYIATVAWAYFILYRSTVTIYDAIGFIVLYIVYAAVVVVGRRVNLYLRRSQAVANRSRSGSTTSTTEALLPHDSPELPTSSAPGDPLPASSPSAAFHSPNVDDAQERCSGDNDCDQLGDVHDDVAILQIAPIGTLRVNTDDDDDEPLVSVSDSEFASATFSANFSSTSTSTLSATLGLPSPWRELGTADKFYRCLSAPLSVVFKLTVPLASYDEEQQQLTGWNQFLFFSQLLLLPAFSVCALGYGTYRLAGTTPLGIISIVFGLLLACLIVAVTQHDKVPALFPLMPYLGFAVSVMWIYVLAEEIVGILRSLGIVADVDAAVLGLTVLAWGNSIGDLITDCALAKAGKSRMALSACFAAPLFNTLLGFGIPFTVSIIQDGGRAFYFARTDINAILIVALASSLVLTLLWMVLTNFRVARLYGITLVSLYVAFLTVSMLDLFDVVKFPFSVIIGGE